MLGAVGGPPAPVVTLQNLDTVHGERYRTDTQRHRTAFDTFQTNVQNQLTNQAPPINLVTISYEHAMDGYLDDSWKQVKLLHEIDLPMPTHSIDVFTNSLTAGSNKLNRFRQNPTTGTGAQQAAVVAAAAAANAGGGGTTLTPDLRALFTSTNSVKLEDIMDPENFAVIIAMGVDKSASLGKKLYKIGMGLACLSVEIRAFRFARPETFSAQVWALLKRRHNKDAPMGSGIARMEGEQRQLEAERRLALDQHARDVAATAPTAAHGAQGQYLLDEARKHSVPVHEQAEYRGGGPKVHIDKNWGRIG